MANAKKAQTTNKINNNTVKMQENPTCTEGQKTILIKIKNGDYSLVKLEMNSSVWKIYREIHRTNGSKLIGRYYCVECKQILKSTGGTNYNLRTHKCYLNYMKDGQLSPLNPSITKHVANTTTTKKRKRENEMSEIEWESNEDDVSTNLDDEYESKKEYDSNQTKKVVKKNPRYVSQRFKWDENATKMFLQLWAAHIDDFRGTRTNTDIHKEMAAEMKKFGLTNVEIKAKIDNMSKRYKKETEITNTTGIPSSWEHFYKLRSLLTNTTTLSNSTAFEEIIMKHSDLEDEESNNSLVEEPESPLQEEEFDESMLQGEEDTSIDVEEPHLEDDFDEQLDTTEPLKYLTEESRAVRLLEIEEEKLQIEREKLNVMKTFKQDLKSFHVELIEMLRRRNNII